MNLIGIGVQLTSENKDRAFLQDQFDKIMMELLFLAARDKVIDDPAVSLDLAEGTIEIEVTVKATSIEAGERAAREVIHEALQAAEEADTVYTSSRHESELLELV